MSVFVGTCGWSYPQGEGRWDGVFYPRGLADREKIGYYAERFQAVEVNSSFYRPLYPNVARAWVKRTPEDFRFCVKLFQKFTHPRMYAEAAGALEAPTDEDFDVALAGLAPFAEAGRLGALLAQFPPSFHADPPRVEYLDSLTRRFGEYPLAVELRHRSWTEHTEARELFQQRHVAWVMIDEPKFRSSIRDVPLTTRLGYFRFHGRNAQEWWRGDRETRYNYLYSANEQAELGAQVQEIAERTDDTYVFYNNHFRAKAVVNALELRHQLGQTLTAGLSEGLIEEYPSLRELADGTPTTPA